MRLLASFRGRDLPPFEGDRVVHLLGLPADARVLAARATMLPDWPADRAFREEVDLTAPDADRFGMTVEESGGGVVADFHARRPLRTLTVVRTPPSAATANLYIDLGGTWGAIHDDGSLAAPGDPPDVTLGTSGLIALPDVVTTRVRVVVPGATGVSLASVGWRAFPANVSLRLGTQGPFLVRLGDLTAPAEAPDFAASLSAFLLDAAVEHGHAVVPVTLHSDGLARLGLELDVEYARERSLLPADVADVTLSFDYDRAPAEAGGAPLAVTVGAGEVVSAAASRGRVAGRFDPTRIALGPEREPVPLKGPQRVGEGVSQAQPVRVERPLAVTALDLLVEPLAEQVELAATIVDDADGRPWGAALLPDPVRFTLRKEPAGGYRWKSAPAAGELQLAPRDDGSPRTYWLVVSAEAGVANWAASAGLAGAELYRTVDGGLSWQEAELLRDPGPLSGLFRLRHLPPQFEMPVELRVGDGEQATLRSLDRFAVSGRVDFPLGEDLAAAVNQYAATAGPTACPAAEHLANGDFSRWLPVDPATEAEVPEDWAVVGRTQRSVLIRFVSEAPVRQALLLLPLEDRTGSLSQVTAATGGCGYRFQFLGVADRPGVLAQVIWREAGCGAARIDAVEVFQLPDLEDRRPSRDELLAFEARLLHRLEVEAPAGATQAEVRFLVPPGTQALFAAVSLVATEELVANPDLAQLGEDGAVVGWAVPPGLVVPGLGASVLDNQGPEEATVTQTVAVPEGSRFALQLVGRAVRPEAAPPRVELAWTAPAGTPVGEPVVHEVGVMTTDVHLVEGEPPAGATAAEVALVLPPGASLEVTSVSLRLPRSVQVPVSFDGESPGELVVSGAAVGLEEVEAVPPPVPAAGLCPPTPPGVTPGPQPPSSPCPSCGRQSTPRRTTPAVTAAGRPAMAARCEHCGARLVRLGGPRRRDAVPLPRGRDRTAEFQRRSRLPVIVADGIGPIRSARLHAAGITELGHLAAAPVGLVARAATLSLEGALDIRAAARRLLLYDRV
jgi:hypothetical protein